MAVYPSSLAMGQHFPLSSSEESKRTSVYLDGDYDSWQQQSYDHQDYYHSRLPSWSLLGSSYTLEEPNRRYTGCVDAPCNAGYGYSDPCCNENYWTKSNYHCYDRHDSPYSHPEESLSPESYHDGYNNYIGTAITSHANTITMPDVQPDVGLNYGPTTEDEYDYQAHESHVFSGELVGSPLSSDDSRTVRYGSQQSKPDTQPPPAIRHRKTNRSSISTVQGARISKRVSLKRAATSSTCIEQKYNSDSETDHERPFHCPLAPYGCASTFSSKNEWKRHFSTQHMRLGYWRCDQCPYSERKPNDFNRKDLFVQHFRRMHGYKHKAPSHRKKKTAKHDDEEKAVADAARRCYMQTRKPPLQSICVVCQHEFSGHGSWDERMEHIGKHFENAKKDGANSSESVAPSNWTTDTDAQEWMIDEKILIEDRRGIVLAGDYSS